MTELIQLSVKTMLCVGACGASKFLKKMCCMLPIALSMKGVESYTLNNTNINNTFGYGEDHDVVVGSSDPSYGPKEEVVNKVSDAAHKKLSTIYFTEQFPRHDHYCEPVGPDMEWYNARGNLSFMTNNKELAEHVLEWSNGDSYYEPPKCIDDLAEPEEAKQLIDVINRVHDHDLAQTAFAAEVEAELHDDGTPEFFD